jgi:hypothetical protein
VVVGVDDRADRVSQLAHRRDQATARLKIYEGEVPGRFGAGLLAPEVDPEIGLSFLDQSTEEFSAIIWSERFLVVGPRGVTVEHVASVFPLSFQIFMDFNFVLTLPFNHSPVKGRFGRIPLHRHHSP